MLYITVTFRLILSNPDRRDEIIDEVMRVVQNISPARGHHLIVTDELNVALIQAKHHGNSKTVVVMVDEHGRADKVYTLNGATVIPRSVTNLSDEILKIIRER